MYKHLSEILNDVRDKKFPKELAEKLIDIDFELGNCTTYIIGSSAMYIVKIRYYSCVWQTMTFYTYKKIYLQVVAGVVGPIDKRKYLPLFNNIKNITNEEMNILYKKYFHIFTPEFANYIIDQLKLVKD